MDPKTNFKETRSKLVLKEYEILNAEATDFPGNYHGYDDKWDFEKFKEKFKIDIRHIEGMDMEFDLIGLDPCFPNAFRRILLSDVPTMAFDRIELYNNTSIIQDEVLAHRLGLIPLKADPRLFEYRPMKDGKMAEATETDTLKFELKVKCSWNNKRTKEDTVADQMYHHYQIVTSDLKWIPIGNQKQMFTAETVGPVVGDILISKMKPGHELDMELHAVKGVGRDHAKFSPVATAYYRLLPEIKLLKEVEGEAAERLQDCFSKGVIQLVSDPKSGKQVAKVADARLDICSRNVYRHEDLKDAVKMTRARDHFIFYIESTGALAPDVLFSESVKILSEKARTFLSELEKCQNN